MEINDKCFEGLSGTQIAVRVMGGQTEVAKKFGYSAQRVQNWMTQGIPKKLIREISEFTGVPVEMLVEQGKRKKPVKV